MNHIHQALSSLPELNFQDTPVFWFLNPWHCQPDRNVSQASKNVQFF